MAPTAATEVVVGLPSHHIKMKAEAQAGIYKLSYNGQGKPDLYGMGMRVKSGT
jgi:hypothetical protein